MYANIFVLNSKLELANTVKCIIVLLLTNIYKESALIPTDVLQEEAFEYFFRNIPELL